MFDGITPRICRQCNETPLKRDQKHYCSSACSAAARRVARNNCAHCGKPVRLTKLKYCSVECSQQQQRDYYGEEFRAKLTQLWSEGISASKIGQRLGVTKSAVAGLVHRMKLPPRPSPIIRTTGPKKPRAPRPAWKPKHTLPPLEPRQVAAFGRRPPRPAAERRVEQIKWSPFKTCQYPYGRERPYRFCGDPTQLGSSYCEKHHRRCHQPRPVVLEDAA